MSRLGKKPVAIPDGVKVSLRGTTVVAEGPGGKVEQPLPPDVAVDIQPKEIRVTRAGDERRHRMMHGLARSLLQNAVTGAKKAYERTLDINGVGYGAKVVGKQLVITCGFSHQVKMDIPGGIAIETPQPTQIIVRGAVKQAVGQFSAEIRGVRPPEPYNLKGIKYRDEIVRKKAGKTFVTGT